jgi:hypothetical protein
VRTRRCMTMALASLLAGSLVLFAAPSLAYGGPTPLTSGYVTTMSWYVNSSNPMQAYNEGLAVGATAASLPPGFFKYGNVLDFGAQINTAGTCGCQAGTIPAFGGIPWLTDAQVENIADQFAEGFYIGTESDTSVVDLIVIGTNNSNTPTSAQGTDWATVVGTATQDAVAGGYASQAVFEGGSDIETWVGTCCNQMSGPATSWLNAFSNAPGGAPGYNIDYGSADQCPLSTNGVNQTCYASANGQTNDYWSISNYQYDAWGNTVAFGAPEMAGTGTAEQWANISLYSLDSGQSKIWFPGPMSESYNYGWVSPATAYSDLNYYLSQDGVPETNMPLVTDLQNPTTTTF